MNLILNFSVFIFYSYLLSLTQARTHEEISKCFLTGVHKMRQTIIESPNYPNNYKADICWDYIIRSPFKCPTKFHIQFLQFDVEFSEGCKNDYLAIGLQNNDNDMDVLCGQVVGIKKYHTPDGILRLRFFTDDSVWTTGKGFKLLITRLACEREELLRKLKDENDDDDADNTKDDNSIAITAPPEFFQPPESELMQIFRNLTGRDQYQIISEPPVYNVNYPPQLPAPPYPAAGTFYLPALVNQRPLTFYPGSDKQNPSPWPCLNDNDQQRELSNLPGYYGALKGHQTASIPNSVGGNFQINYIPLNKFTPPQLPARDQYIGSWSNTPTLWKPYDNTIDVLEACCVTAFKQKHFYLSSPGFPRTIFSNILPDLPKRDCVFHLQKSVLNVCRLRLEMKFFDFGQNYQGTDSFRGNIGHPAIQSTYDVCQEDFIEIDNQRFCGCRSGFTFTTYWPAAADKRLRMRMGYSGIPSSGFLLEFVQEECSETELDSVATAGLFNSNLLNNQLVSPQQNLQNSLELQNKYVTIYPNQQQQEQQKFSLQHHQQTQIQDDSLNNPIRQQIFNTPAGVPTYLQPPKFLLNQQQKQPQFSQNNYPYPSYFGSNYFTSADLQQNYLKSPAFNINHNFGLPQIRYARSYGDQQPNTVVETNSTRKEYYYGENEVQHDDDPKSPLIRSSSIGRKTNWDRKDENINENINSFSVYGREGRKCTFDMGDILRLSDDILWITRPICYAPQRKWLTNLIS